MRKLLLLATTLLFSLTTYAQNPKIKFVVTEKIDSPTASKKKVSFATEDGKDYYVLTFPGKKANDLYTDVMLRTIRKFKSMPVTPQTFEGRAFILSGETDYVNYAEQGMSASLAYLDFNILFEFKDGKIRIHAPVAPAGKRLSMDTGSEYKIYLNTIYENDKNAISKTEDFINKLITDIAFPCDDDNW